MKFYTMYCTVYISRVQKVQMLKNYYLHKYLEQSTEASKALRFDSAYSTFPNTENKKQGIFNYWHTIKHE